MIRKNFVQRVAESKVWALYPIPLAAAPALHMAAANAEDLDVRSTMIASTGCAVLAAGALCLLQALRRQSHRAAAMTCWLLLLFFTFGRVFEALWNQLGLSQLRQLLIPLYGVYALLAIGGVAWVWRTKTNVRSFTQFAAVMALVLYGAGLRAFVHEHKHEVRDERRAARAEERARIKQLELAKAAKAAGSASGVQLAAYEEVSSAPAQVKAQPLSPAELAQMPDVYYIILDGYAREDVLRDVYNYDNSEFINSLRARGFYVADQSNSNYPMTILSVPSSLNMRYLTPEFKKYGWKYQSYAPLIKLAHDNAVARHFKEQGYRVVHFATNWRATADMDDADIVYHPEPWFLQQEFMGVFLRTTALRPFAASVADTHLFMFDKLKDIPDDPRPTFTFAHFILPHNPYVFDADGNRRLDIPPEVNFHREEGAANPWHDRQGYVDQLAFASRKIRESIDAILAKSERPPIIILQSDHGSASQRTDDLPSRQQPEFVHERMCILNAYYVPEGWKSSLYQDITPVNSFRVVFNHLFGDHYELLPDKMYFSWYRWPFNAKEVTKQLRPDKAAADATALH